MKGIVCFLLLISVCSCQSSSFGSRCTSDIFSAAMGSSRESRNGLAAEKIIDNLNHSKVAEASLELLSNVKIDTLYYNSYYYLSPSSLTNDSLFFAYAAYRIAEYTGDVDKNTLLNMLLTSFGGNSPIKTKCIDVLYSVENAYLQCCSSNSDKARTAAIDTLKKYNKEFPDSKRIRYLLANANFEVGKKEDGIKQLKKIITGDYYVQPAIKRIIDYYIEIKRPDSLKVYSSFYSNAFPDYCNLGKLVLNSLGKNNNEEFQRCKGKYFSQKDSIEFNVLLARNLLNYSPEKALSLYNEFEDANNDFILDSVKIWEKGQYYDIKLRYFFITKNYDKMVEFINKNMGYNKLINIKNDSDLQRLIDVYYKDYINPNINPNEFQTFFNKRFLKKKKIFSI